MVGRYWSSFVTMLGATVPGGVLRFALFVPTGVYDNLVRIHQDMVVAHAELQGGLYNSLIAATEKTASEHSTFVFWWTMSVWLPSIAIPPPVNLIFSSVDAFLAIRIAQVTSHQAAFVPHSIDACKGAHDFQRPAGANESFFDAAARLNATKADSFHMCKAFVQEWQYGVTISVIYALIAFCNLAGCLAVMTIRYRAAKRENSSFWRAVGKDLLEVPRVIGWTLWLLTYSLSAVLFRCLPFRVKTPVRMARRRTVKLAIGAEQKTKMQLRAVRRVLTTKKGRDVVFQKRTGEPTNLADFLGIYDMLMLVTENLHYTDIVTLARVSSSLREAVLPAAAHHQRTLHFKRYTCDRASKTQCWSCINQVCDDCSALRALPSSILAFHAAACKPHCTPCYRLVVHHRYHYSLPNDSRHCKCAPRDPAPNAFKRWWWGPGHYTRRSIQCYAAARRGEAMRRVCKVCEALPEAEIQAVRERRTRWELKCGEGEAMGCAKCGMQLGKGIRWWVCDGCKMECRSLVHKALGSGKSSKGNEEEEGATGTV